MGDVVKHTVEIDGYHLVVTGGDEAMIEDAELAKKLRFQSLAGLRQLVRRLLGQGFLKETEVMHAVSETSAKGGRRGVFYRFTRIGAIKVISRSETAVANATAIASVVLAERPLFRGDPDRLRTAALVVAVAFRRENRIEIDTLDSG